MKEYKILRLGRDKDSELEEKTEQSAIPHDIIVGFFISIFEFF